MIFSESDKKFMQQALVLAQQAANQEEVPVGALLVSADEIIAEGYNQPISICDPTAHAEIVALRAAAQQQKNYRLPTTTLYVTLEPCIMCAGAIIHARIERLVFGAFDPKSGACGSTIDIFKQKVNHRVAYQGGLLANECAKLLQTFFAARR
ncbi:MAG: tRNA adenosine(34) deaminase TadA [Gammaproteobacteria bacterium]|nr:tRNA adenosine(34) deaminase TadA [Gammaproteobacteria bacterium]MCP4476274.1 tRNA adenosine(34) deaminase TadA [Gammaproteobacteria bacterium]